MNQNAKIPFVDLITPHRELQDELVNVFKSTLATAGFIGGPMVEGFESDFAKYCDAKFCVGVNSGTDALRFALSAAGVGSGGIAPYSGKVGRRIQSGMAPIARFRPVLR